MDSGRLALLEKAREFGSLARTLSWSEVLDRSATYRALAFYLSIQKEWWEEFWRSFSFSAARRGTRRFQFSGKVKSLPSIMSFLSNWFGRDARLSDIDAEELRHAFSIVMRH